MQGLLEDLNPGGLGMPGHKTPDILRREADVAAYVERRGKGVAWRFQQPVVPRLYVLGGQEVTNNVNG